MDKIMGNIIVVDDDPEMCGLLKDILSGEGHMVTAVTNGKDALDNLSEEVDLVVTDLRLQEMKGLELMNQVKGRFPDVSVIIITAFGTIESAIEAMKMGAYDYIPKPFKMDELTLGVQKALRENSLRREVLRLRKEVGKEYQFDNLIGKSKSMQTIFDLIRRIAGTSTNILVTGESGTGKEVVAKAIHYNSSRRDRPFIPVNCAAIPDTLLESELFGHVKGAFTDAKTNKTGLMEEASGGTLFLDEISELPIGLQAKFLRAIQDKEVRRVGANSHTKVDVRIIAASNLDLLEEVKAHRFRDDLFYRLNVIQVQIPPLRERRDDIIPLVSFFLKKFRAETKKDVSGFSESALSLMMNYAWPGNIRELENSVERAIILCRGEQILPEDLPPVILGDREDYVSLETGIENQFTLGELEDHYIRRVLAQNRGNKFKTAQVLGIDRKTLYRKLGHEKKKERTFTGLRESTV
ncbi:MAG TPA: sigma-54 dependent transcriptional regulator [Nitrospiria bacterium]